MISFLIFWLFFGSYFMGEGMCFIHAHGFPNTPTVGYIACRFSSAIWPYLFYGYT